VIPPFRAGLRGLASRGAAWLLLALLLLPGVWLLSPAKPAWAGPVAWQELAASAEAASGGIRAACVFHARAA